jgi:hypothetical protein
MLDVLLKIKDEQDQTLAFRRSCRRVAGVHIHQPRRSRGPPAAPQVSLLPGLSRSRAAARPAARRCAANHPVPAKLSQGGHLRLLRDEHRRPEQPGMPLQGRSRPRGGHQGRAAAAHVRGQGPGGGHVQLLLAVQVHQAVPAEEGDHRVRGVARPAQGASGRLGLLACADAVAAARQGAGAGWEASPGSACWPVGLAGAARCAAPVVWHVAWHAVPLRVWWPPPPEQHGNKPRRACQGPAAQAGTAAGAGDELPQPLLPGAGLHGCACALPAALPCAQLDASVHQRGSAHPTAAAAGR